MEKNEVTVKSLVEQINKAKEDKVISEVEAALLMTTPINSKFDLVMIERYIGGAYVDQVIVEEEVSHTLAKEY